MMNSIGGFFHHLSVVMSSAAHGIEPPFLSKVIASAQKRSVHKYIQNLYTYRRAPEKRRNMYVPSGGY